MLKQVLCCIAVTLLAYHMVSAQDFGPTFSTNARNYVKQYASLAMMEQRLNGIPAAITLGQGILETEAGTSELMTKANNHFGIKCKTGWTGETFAHTDDAPNECFKKYKCTEDSYRDHSEYLKRNQRYARLFTLKQTDYKGWATCLKRCGYATNPKYAQKLIEIIETFGLQQYTYAAYDTVAAAGVASSSDYKFYQASYVTRSPDTAVKVTQAVVRDTLKQTVAAPKTSAPPHIIITHDKHTVAEGETVASIAKMEHVDAKLIMQYNFLYPNEEPIAGSILELQKPASRKPDVWINSMPAHNGNAIVGGNDKAPQGSDYISINKGSEVNSPVAAQQSNTMPATTTPMAEPPAKMRYTKQESAPTAPAEDNPEKDKQLTAMKADLDKVVYADDSKLITGNTAQPPTSLPKPQAAATTGSKYYTVKKGDTAFSIAKKNNISLNDLEKWNGMSSGTVKTGQKLRITE